MQPCPQMDATPANTMEKHSTEATKNTLSQTPFRDCLQLNANEVAVFGCDVCSQPHYNIWSKGNQALHLKCSRALPIAGPDDIVILSGPLFEPYLEWLRGFGLGPGEVVSYGASDSRIPLAELIRENPGPLEGAIRRSGRQALYVPFYSDARINELCAAKGWGLFGCVEETTLQYFDKQRFKNLCAALEIPTVEGVNFGAKKSYQPSPKNLERFLLALLGSYPSLVIRGTLGSAGKSVYQVESSSLSEVVSQIQEDCGSEFLVEPFLQVITSPNDQWCIRRDGSTAHIGLSAQLFDGFKHKGNLFGQYLSPRVLTAIDFASQRIVREMAKAGYRSVVGIDYVVADGGVFPIENNARLNGSTFSFAIVDAIRDSIPEVARWKFYKAVIEPCRFEVFLEKLSPVLYDGSKLNSVFPFDCDLIETTGSFEVLLLAEDLYHLDFLERTLKELGVSHQ